MESWRLILDEPGDCGLNMAADEAIVRAADSHPDTPPTLRLYGWKAPAISIGYMQDAAPFLDCSLPVVRRITGGRAVLHDIELTYSVTAARGASIFSGGILEAYSAISGCIIAALNDAGIDAVFSRWGLKAGGLGSPACFHTPSRYEVLVNGRKLVGSSQRRFKNAFLQHGSILFSVNEEMNRRIFGAEAADKMAGIGSYKPVSIEDFKKVLIRRMAEGLNASFAGRGLTAEEEDIKERLVRTKYSNPLWNLSAAGC